MVFSKTHWEQLFAPFY